MSRAKTNHTPAIGRQGGFSLVELVVIVAVLAIVSSIALPSFRNMMRSNRLTATSNELNAVLQGARMDAIRINGRVDVCPSTSGTGCDGGNWQRLVVISRKNGANEVLRDVALGGNDITITPSSSISSSNVIWYQADGFVRTGSASSPTQVGTLSVCASGLPGNNARNVQVNMGRVSISRVANAACNAPGDNG
ncbi:prepilin [Lysobacteraceae bacterium NML120232]|nr:prepilin [Xanthomonadaceae bacterium NML08-0793]PJK13803.1 prepilin [Xanthomonadaceae bacterium NML120232]